MYNTHLYNYYSSYTVADGSLEGKNLQTGLQVLTFLAGYYMYPRAEYYND